MQEALPVAAFFYCKNQVLRGAQHDKQEGLRFQAVL